MKPWVTKRIKLEYYKATENQEVTLRAVIADDEEPTCAVLEMAMKSLGHEVVGIARDGAQTVDMVLKHRPDIAIIDINMPGYNGIEAARIILGEFSLPVIFCTGRVDDEALALARELNIHAYLVKPFGRSHLKSAISMALSRHRSEIGAEVRIASLEGELSTAHTIDYAIGLLSKNYKLTREAAMKRIEKEAESTECSVIEAAHHLIRAELIRASDEKETPEDPA